MADSDHRKKLRTADVPVVFSLAEMPPQADEEDFIFLDVRAISARVIPGHWLDFPAELLKGAVEMLKGMPIFLDHTRYTWQQVGTVLETWWNDELRLGAPGINAKLRLDKQVMPSGLVRQMTADPPFKCPVSITWFGEYAQSHPDLSPSEFRALLGETYKGQLVRWVATQIDEIPEISLVWAGADRSARALAHAGDDMNLGQAPGGPPDERRLNMAENDNGIVAAVALALQPLALALGLTPQQMSDQEGLAAHLGAALQKLQTKVAELEPMAEVGQAYLQGIRDEAMKMAALKAEDGKLDDGLKAVIEGADLATAKTLLTQFGGQVAQGLTAVCPTCKKSVPIRSSLEQGAPPEQATGKADAQIQDGKDMAGLVNQQG